MTCFSTLFKSSRTENISSLRSVKATLTLSIDDVVHRTFSEYEERVLLAFAGEVTAPWYHEPEVTRDRIAKAWPSLTDAQLTRACRAVNGLIRAPGDASTLTRKRSGWAAWRPHRPSQTFDVSGEK